MGLLERLETVLNEKWSGNQSRMSEGCGLRRTHIGTLIRRLREDPEANIESDTLKKIALYSGFRLAWLVSGEGVEKEDRLTDPPMPNRFGVDQSEAWDRRKMIREMNQFVYTNLEPILAMLEAAGEPAPIVAALKAERLAPDAEDHTEEYWLQRVDHYRAIAKGTLRRHTTEDDGVFGFVPGKSKP